MLVAADLKNPNILSSVVDTYSFRLAKFSFHAKYITNAAAANIPTHTNAVAKIEPKLLAEIPAIPSASAKPLNANTKVPITKNKVPSTPIITIIHLVKAGCCSIHSCIAIIIGINH